MLVEIISMLTFPDSPIYDVTRHALAEISSPQMLSPANGNSYYWNFTRVDNVSANRRGSGHHGPAFKLSQVTFGKLGANARLHRLTITKREPPVVRHALLRIRDEGQRSG